MTDLYALLGVARTVDAESLKAAWRRLAREHHPDRNPGDPGAAERLAAINAAYAVLSDPERRRLYDTYGDDAASAFFDASRVAAPAPRRARSVERGEDLRVTLELSALEARQGGAHTVEVEPSRSCVHCGGTGWRRAGRACSRCEGGVVPGIGPFRIPVPAGVISGTELVVRGAGRAGRGKGAEPGDLYVTVRVRAHFRREPEAVYVEVPCPSEVRRDGGKLRVPLPGGAAVKMTVPAGSRVGRKLRLRGRGGQGTDLVVVLAEGPGETREVRAIRVVLD